MTKEEIILLYGVDPKDNLYRIVYNPDKLEQSLNILSQALLIKCNIEDASEYANHRNLITKLEINHNIFFYFKYNKEQMHEDSTTDYCSF